MNDLELAERAALAAGDVLLSYYGRPAAGLTAKSSETDLVSDADRDAERTVRDLLRAERPDDGLLAEEGSSSEAVSGRRWIVDPLDGTINFLYGFPAWAVSVALEDPAGLVVGVVHSPVHRETFRAGRGEGAWVVADGQQREIRVSGCDRLDRALLATGFSYERERRVEQAEVIRDVLPQVRDVRRAGAAALDLAWLAAGRLDAYFERGLHRWDWAAGRLLIEEAGGAIERLDGEPMGLVAAATPKLLADLRGYLPSR